MLPVSKSAGFLPAVSTSTPQAPVLPSAAKTLLLPMGGDGFDTGPARTWTQFNGPLHLAQGDTDPVVGGTSTPVTSTVELSEKSAKAIENMWRGNDPALTEDQQKRIKAAFTTLSEKEILQLDQSGMRIWNGRELPPELKEKGINVKPISTRAAYVVGAKVLLMNPDNPPKGSDLRHELGHARDDIWDEAKATKPLEKLSKKEAMRQFEKNAGMMSTSSKKHATKIPKDGKYGELVDTKVTIKQAYDNYVKRTENQSPNNLFNSGNARSSYSKSSPEEFFAEAYAVYHGQDEVQQARLLTFAPEMFFILQADAKKKGMPTLDAKALESVNVIDMY